MKTKSLSILGILILMGLLLVQRGQATHPNQEEIPTIEPPLSRLGYDGVLDSALTYFPSNPQNIDPALLNPFVSELPNSHYVFQSLRDDNWEIYIVYDYQPIRLTSNSAPDIHPRLNHGCTQIVFTSKRTENYEIYVMNADGSGVTQLTNNGTDDVYPAWSPDGRRIAFQSYRDGQAEIYVMNADSTGVARLTWDNNYDGMPVWSPDGSQIAFVSNRSGGYRIHVMNADSSNLIQLSNQAYSEFPSWSPDGTQIAYSADNDDDGWLELMLMNADGTDQHQLYKANGQNDAWVKSWSPNGRYITFTQIAFIYWNGNWYWESAYLRAWNTYLDESTVLITSGLDWHPDWQSTDGEFPVSGMDALPFHSPVTFPLHWSGSDTGPAGLKGFQIQVRDGVQGSWTNWITSTTETSAQFIGFGGHRYYFRARALDNGGNLELWPVQGYDTFTAIEGLPPVSKIDSLPVFSDGQPLYLTLLGQDLGGSGLESYDLQYRDGASGNWTDWLTDYISNVAKFNGSIGHTYYFRIRGQDNAQNIEAWPLGDGDTSTTLCQWSMDGLVSDNSGASVSNVSITTTPNAMRTFQSAGGGYYAICEGDDSPVYTVNWSKDGYGEVPATGFADDFAAPFSVILPPENNIIPNWGFETGDFDNWNTSGEIAPVVTDTLYHTGNYGALLGNQEWHYAPAISLVEDGYTQAVLDQSGTLHVIYGFDSDVYYISQSKTGEWSSPVLVGRNRSAYMNLAVDQSGRAHAVWIGYDDSGYKIFYNWQNDSGQWLVPSLVAESGNGIYFERPLVVVDHQGNAHIIWNDNIGTWYVHQTNNYNWSLPERPFSDGTYPQKMVVDRAGGIHMSLSYGGASDAAYTHLQGNGTWTTPVWANIPNSPYTAYQDFVVDDYGTAHLAVMGIVDDRGEIYYIQCTTNGCATPVNLSNTISPSYDARLIVADKTVHMVWTDERSEGDEITEIFYSKRVENDLWTTPVDISQNEFGVENPAIAMDERENIHVIWVGDNLDGDDVVYYKTANQYGEWSESYLILPAETPSRGISPIFIGMGANKKLHILYTAGLFTYYAGTKVADSPGDSSIELNISVPSTMPNPTLSFLYQLSGGTEATATGFKVQVNDGVTATTLLQTSTATVDWTQVWFNLSPWKGKLVTITFNAHQAADSAYTNALIDEITLGSAYPDVWSEIQVEKEIVRPSEFVTYTLIYGNNGGAGASNVIITNTLPSGVAFVSASVAPDEDDSSLVWNVPNLDAKGTATITVTVQVTAPAGSELVIPVAIGTALPELEMANNAWEDTIFVRELIFLPVLMR